MSELERFIWAMTKPHAGAYPRPWMTDTNPEAALVLIVGASSAKTFHTSVVGNHQKFLDALWNRNGYSCRAMYDAATKGRPSRTRQNLDRLSEMLAVQGLPSLQTNIACASAPYDDQLTAYSRAHGTELFKIVIGHVRWRAMIVHGTGVAHRFGKMFGMAMPPVPPTSSKPVSVQFMDRPVFVSPTLAAPGYRSSVWPYLEEIVAEIGIAISATPLKSPPVAQAIASSPPRRMSKSMRATPDQFNSSEANLLVWERMHEVEKLSPLQMVCGARQASLMNGPKLSNTRRIFRHKFLSSKPDILVREDVFEFDPELLQNAMWSTHKTPVFWNIRMDDLSLLNRILDMGTVFSAARQSDPISFQ